MARCLRRRAWLRPHRGRRDGRQLLIPRRKHATKTNSPDLSGDAAGGYFNRGHDETSASADDVPGVKNDVWTFEPSEPPRVGIQSPDEAIVGNRNRPPWWR